VPRPDAAPATSRTAWPARRDSETASVLLLMPAAVLVLVVLASIALDSAVVFLGQRELANAAAAAARDGASAVSSSRFYGGGVIAVDAAEAERRARAAIAARDVHGVTLSGPVAVTVAGRQVCVTVTGRVDRIVARSIPGVPGRVTVRARSTATAAGGLDSAVPRRAIC